jgi:hypothetical protein
VKYIRKDENMFKSFSEHSLNLRLLLVEIFKNFLSQFFLPPD